MKEFVEKLIGKLEEEVEYQDKKADESDVFEEVSVSHTRISMRKCYEHAIEIINELAEEYNNGWIPCSEKLPEEAKTILICTKTGLVDVGARHVSYEHNEYKTYKNIFWDDEVIAWQPLPQSYKEGSEEDA